MILMSLYDLIVSRRTIRQFAPVPIARSLLEKLINAARLAPSAGNLQPLQFVVVDDDAARKDILACLRWAGYIAPEGNPKPGHVPQAYVITLANTTVREKGYEYDIGAAMENMILAAWEEGLGACWLISVDRQKIAEILRVPESYKVDCVLALGYPDEKPVVEELKDSAKYWKDEKGVLHVPKRIISDIIHFNKF
jgi:nitroreductase